MQTIAVTALPARRIPWETFLKLQAIEHPNLCRYLDLEISSSDGQDIAFVAQSTYEPTELSRVESWRDFAFDVLSGIAHLHAHGIFHGALTADSLRVTNEGLVKLAGWGLSTQVSDDLVSLASILEVYYFRSDNKALCEFIAECRDPSTTAGDLLSSPALEEISRPHALWRPARLRVSPLPTRLDEGKQGPLAKLRRFGITALDAYQWWRLSGSSPVQLFAQAGYIWAAPHSLRVPLFSCSGSDVKSGGSDEPWLLTEAVHAVVDFGRLHEKLENLDDSEFAEEYRLFRTVIESKDMTEAAREHGVPVVLRRLLWPRLLGVDERIMFQYSDDSELNIVDEIFDQVIRRKDLATLAASKFKSLGQENELWEGSSMEKAVCQSKACLFGNLYHGEDLLRLWDLLICHPDAINSLEEIIRQAAERSLPEDLAKHLIPTAIESLGCICTVDIVLRRVAKRQTVI